MSTQYIQQKDQILNDKKQEAEVLRAQIKGLVAQGNQSKRNAIMLMEYLATIDGVYASVSQQLDKVKQTLFALKKDTLQAATLDSSQ